MFNGPQISVVMSAYNGAKCLSASIDSALAQTERDFEFIIVNDGSTDSRVAEILSEYKVRDERIKIISKSNAGLTRALIDGCAAAKGKYIARIDVGDVMLPERLARQKAVLDAQPDVVFVSCWTEYCGPEWEHLYVHRVEIPVDGENICPADPNSYPERGPTHHGSVMLGAEPMNPQGDIVVNFIMDRTGTYG